MSPRLALAKPFYAARTEFLADVIAGSPFYGVSIPALQARNGCAENTCRDKAGKHPSMIRGTGQAR